MFVKVPLMHFNFEGIADNLPLPGRTIHTSLAAEIKERRDIYLIIQIPKTHVLLFWFYIDIV